MLLIIPFIQSIFNKRKNSLEINNHSYEYILSEGAQNFIYLLYASYVNHSIFKKIKNGVRTNFNSLYKLFSVCIHMPNISNIPKLNEEIHKTIVMNENLSSTESSKKSSTDMNHNLHNSSQENDVLKDRKYNMTIKSMLLRYCNTMSNILRINIKGVLHIKSKIPNKEDKNLYIKNTIYMLLYKNMPQRIRLLTYLFGMTYTTILIPNFIANNISNNLSNYQPLWPFFKGLGYIIISMGVEYFAFKCELECKKIKESTNKMIEQYPEISQDYNEQDKLLNESITATNESLTACIMVAFYLPILLLVNPLIYPPTLLLAYLVYPKILDVYHTISKPISNRDNNSETENHKQKDSILTKYSSIFQATVQKSVYDLIMLMHTIYNMNYTGARATCSMSSRFPDPNPEELIQDLTHIEKVKNNIRVSYLFPIAYFLSKIDTILLLDHKISTNKYVKKINEDILLNSLGL